MISASVILEYCSDGLDQQHQRNYLTKSPGVLFAVPPRILLARDYDLDCTVYKANIR